MIDLCPTKKAEKTIGVDCICTMTAGYSQCTIIQDTEKLKKLERKRELYYKIKNVEKTGLHQNVCGIMTGAYFSTENVILNNFIYIYTLCVE